MKTVTVWSGAVVQVGETIELRVLRSTQGVLKLGIVAPKECRIVRQGGAPPPRGRRLKRPSASGRNGQ